MNSNTYPETLRLPYGQRVIITSAFNNWRLPIGTTGTIVEIRDSKKPRRIGSEYFWKGWQEQFVLFDGKPDGLDCNPTQIRRGHMAPTDDWDPQ